MSIRPISWITAFVFLVSTTASADIPLKYFDDLATPHYLLGGVYAFEFNENEVPNLGRVRSAYLPNGTLVYPIALDPAHRPANLRRPDRYGTYITQFGQVLLILNDVVSRRSFAQNLGEADVIFHQDSFICADPAELDCHEDDGVPFSKSWATVSERDRQKKLVKLRYFIPEDDQERLGYLSLDRFDKMKREGVVSDLKEPWPRYAFIGKREISLARKPCGTTRTKYDSTALKAEIGVEAEAGLFDWFKAKFAAGFETENGSENVFLVGEGDIEIRLYELRILKPDTEGKFDPDQVLKLTVTARFACGGFAGALQPYQSDSIIVQHTHPDEIEGRGRVTLAWSDFHSEELAPRDAEYIWDKNRQRPFAFSVNSSVAYEATIEKIQEITEFDRALSNILLSAFNASCESREGAREICEELLR